MLVVENGECREERWYKFSPTPFTRPKEATEATHELLELYKNAVRRHLLSDVPVGLLLSGGIDSGLLLALMNEQGGPWPAYTVGYGDTFKDDELTDAAETAAILGARHVTVKLDQSEFERSLPKIVECLEEPIAASSIVPMYFVSQRARQDVGAEICAFDQDPERPEVAVNVPGGADHVLRDIDVDSAGVVNSDPSRNEPAWPKQTSECESKRAFINCWTAGESARIPSLNLGRLVEITQQFHFGKW